jgi:hypothetical protein
LGGKVPVPVGFFRDDDAVSWAGCHTQSAAFASFEINCYFACHLGDYAQLCFWFGSQRRILAGWAVLVKQKDSLP